jgi:serine/threonine-protein kinase
VVCQAVYTGESFCPIDGGAVVDRDDQQPDPYVGRTIDGRYLVHRRLGKGGMGVVYEATHIGLDRRVAIKFLLGAEGDADALARFRREARIASKIDHDHVVDILDVGRDGSGTDYLVMELVEGRDLQQILATDGRMEPARAISLVRQILAGLAAIHAAGIVHRDLKPSNVIVVAGEAGELAKIMDFGISKSMMSAAGDNVTDTGHVIGTPMYMSPEQLFGEPLDPRSDVFSVGLILFTLLAGQPAFAGNTMSRVAAMRATVDAPLLSTIRDDLAPALVDVVATALALQCGDRFATANDFADALQAVDLTSPARPSADRWMQRTVSLPPPQTQDGAKPTQLAKPANEVGKQTEIDPPARPERARSRLPLVVAAVVVVALVIGGVFYATRSSNAEQPTAGSAVDATVATVAVDAPVREDAVALARRAEEAGKLPLAIALYEDAVNTATTPRPDLVFHLAELHERIGEPAKAVTFLTRYLELSPEAPDAQHVRDRIARLAPPKPPARITVEPPKRSPLVATPPAPKQPPKKCYCYPEHGSDATHWKLCRALSKTKPCACFGKLSGIWRPLCSKPGTGCSMPSEGCYDALRCDDPGFGKYNEPANKVGQSCTGYRDGDAITGEYQCQVCDPAVGLAFEGQHGDPCVGYTFNTGQRVEGHLNNCN